MGLVKLISLPVPSVKEFGGIKGNLMACPVQMGSLKPDHQGLVRWVPRLLRRTAPFRLPCLPWNELLEPDSNCATMAVVWHMARPRPIFSWSRKLSLSAVVDKGAGRSWRLRTSPRDVFTEIANGPTGCRKSFADCFINSLTVPWSYNFDYSGSFRNHKYFTQKDWFLPVLAGYQLLFHSICGHDLQGDPLRDKVATAFRQEQTDVPVAGTPKDHPELPFVPFTSKIWVH